MAPRIRREQICSRCRNHGILNKLKDHKKFCQYQTCECEKCRETSVRQKFIAREIQFHRSKQKSKRDGCETTKKIPEIKFRDSDFDVTQNATCEVRKHQMCARCRNHDQDNPIKGHKNKCAFASCTCEKCLITEERRKIMAKQIRENRTCKISSDEDDGYAGSPKTVLDSIGEGFKYPAIDELSLHAPAQETLLFDTEAPADEDEMKYMVQSLFEKCFVHGNSTTRLQVLYALVMQSKANWSTINEFLDQGSQLASLNVEEHLKMVEYHQYLLAQSLLRQQLANGSPHQPHLSYQQVRLKPMGGNF